jgi:O-antigen/teichoic acid export membrane protein
MKVLSGLNKLVGFGLSMAMLAVAALIAIPAMIRASGEVAWGTIAVGQSVGALGAMLVLYGWSVSGPAEVARGDAQAQLTEFLSSLKVRLFLFPMAAVVAVAISMLLAPVRKDLAGIATVVTLLTGLIHNWFFVGLARPYVLMIVETVPRLSFTIIGIVAMETGSDAGLGLIWQGVGLLIGTAMSTWWILWHLGDAMRSRPKLPPLSKLLVWHGHGVASTIGSGLYGTLPLVVVTLVAPAAQPIYALVDKLHAQILVGLFPAISVMQGWVPRSQDPAPRARKVMIFGLGLSALIGVFAALIGPWLLHFFGAQKLVPTSEVILMMAVGLGLHFYVETLGHAILATYRRLRVLSWSILIAAVIALPLVAVGSLRAGALGALVAVNLGYLIRMGIVGIASARCIRDGGAVDEGPSAVVVTEELG